MSKTALILAGGQATRMNGRDKGLLEFSGQSFISHILERLRPQVDHILISGTHDYDSGLEVLNDLPEGPKGPSAALHAMSRAKPELDSFITVPVDSPFLPHDLYNQLAGETSAIAVGPEREHPTFAFWKMSDLKTAFQGFTGQGLPLLKLADIVKARRINFRAESYFTNFNRPEDLAQFS